MKVFAPDMAIKERSMGFVCCSSHFHTVFASHEVCSCICTPWVDRCNTVGAIVLTASSERCKLDIIAFLIEIVPWRFSFP